MSELLTREEVARVLGVNEGQVCDMYTRGGAPASGGLTRVQVLALAVSRMLKEKIKLPREECVRALQLLWGLTEEELMIHFGRLETAVCAVGKKFLPRLVSIEAVEGHPDIQAAARIDEAFVPRFICVRDLWLRLTDEATRLRAEKEEIDERRRQASRVHRRG